MDEMSKAPAFVETGLKSLVTEVAFSLAAWRGDSWRASGTAVSIAARLLITAKHVVADYWDHLERPVALRGSLNASFRVLARQMLSEGEEMVLWTVRRIWLSPNTDIAFLLVDPFSESAKRYSRWRVPPLQLLPPAPGDRVVAFGYHTPEVQVSLNGPAMTVTWDDHPSTAVGEVTETYAVKRDSSFLNFPCFQTNSRFEGGMSGGPIFNDAGEVCGLVCSSLLQPSSDGHISFAVCPWPSMATFIHVGLDGRVAEHPVRVLDLARAGILNVRGAEKLSIVPEADDYSIRLQLSPKPNACEGG